MAEVIGIKFKTNAKIYYFDPCGIAFSEGDGAVVETQRGVEYGTVALENREVPDNEIVHPLKPVTRKATAADIEAHNKNLAERDRLIEESRKKVEAHNLKMKIVDAEYTFDRGKVIIYFTADGRIDFRELVRDLAGLFRNRIELRQIYERDDIKLRGALAQCGRPCCCTTFLKDYEKVSIRMAKYQGLSLNPGKISGCCGKLMCCLRYENAYYQEMAKKMPKPNSTVSTKEGNAVVLENDPLREEVKLKFNYDDGSTAIKKLPLSELKFSRGADKHEDVSPEDDADELPDEADE